MTESLVQKNIAQWKRDLLDLSRRNRLVYYRPLKRASVQILEPDIYQLFTRLDDEESSGRGLAFPRVISRPTPEQPTPRAEEVSNTELPTADAGILPGVPALRQARLEWIFADDGDLRTERNPHDQELSLKALQAGARLFEEEQGINTLFLALGMLEWTDAESGESGRAPLVLVPVSLRRESPLHPFVLVRRDEDIETNATLRHLLRTQFNVTLPEFEREGDERLLDYLAGVEDVVGVLGFRLEEEAHLSQLHFNKMAMVEDLEAHRELAEDHPFIRRLVGEAGSENAVMSQAEDVPDDLLDSRVRPTDLFTVLDADSSQVQALRKAQAGENLVIFGPPGTGKSQTITNLIAQMLFDGKRVLFVSEKQAALEVVHRNLQRLKLDRYCLELHGSRTSKARVLEQLRRSLNGDDFVSPAKDTEGRLDYLYQLRLKLNGYAEALHRAMGAQHLTPYAVHGRVARAGAIRPVDFTPSVASVHAIEYGKQLSIHQLLDELAAFAREPGTLRNHPWWGADAEFKYSLDLRDAVRDSLEATASSLEERARVFAAVAPELGITLGDTVADHDHFQDLLATIAEVPGTEGLVLPIAWFTTDHLSTLVERCRELDRRSRERLERLRVLESRFERGIVELDQRRLINDLTDETRVFWSTASAVEGQQEAFVCAHESDIRRDLGDLVRTITGVVPAGRMLANVLGLETYADFRTLLNLAGLVGAGGWAARNWFNPGGTAEARATVVSLRAHWDRLRALDREVEGVAAPLYLAAVPVSEMRDRFTVSYRGFFRFLKGSYRKDMGILRTAWRGARKLDYRSALALLAAEAERRATQMNLADLAPAGTTPLGQHYQGRGTDWDAAASALDTAERIAELLAPNAAPARLVAIATQGGADGILVEDARKQLSELFEALNGATNRASRWLSLPLAARLGRFDGPSIAAFAEAMRTLSGVAEKFYGAWDAVVGLTVGVAPSYADAVAALREADLLVSAGRQIAESIRQEGELLSSVATGADTNWPAVAALLSWAQRVRAAAGTGVRDEERFARMLTGRGIPGIALAGDTAARLSRETSQIASGLELLHGLYGTAADVSLPVDAAMSWLRAHSLLAHRLPEYVRFKRLREQSMELGLGDLVDVLAAQDVPADQIVDRTLLRFDRLWLYEAYGSIPELREFSPEEHDRLIAEFRQLDDDSQRAWARAVASAVSSRQPRPSPYAPVGSELDILQKAVEMRRMKRPLRWLLRSCAGQIQGLRPCLMMSPLSVATYLAKGHYRFDVVIFDEASQVRPEDAMGAIVRVDQAIVAGDDKQLPPTSFFQRQLDFEESADEDEDSDLLELGGQESILDLATAAQTPKAHLRWHYRSRHESLIAFSNEHFYTSNLITYPGFAASRDEGRTGAESGNSGVTFVHVPDGRWEGTGRGNRVEAERIVDLVFEHFERHGDSRSLGVIALGKSQEERIREAIEARLLARGEFQRLFAGEGHEPFFVKNLETVQGDERDDIIISIGYGPGASGVFKALFGPINSVNGARRLNVAVTRARRRCTVVASFLPEQIPVDRLKNQGPGVLNEYLRYARNGGRFQPDALAGDEGDYESEFEEAVADVLRERGYRVDAQVGSSPVKRQADGRLNGFRIDLGVRHPDYPDYYILGVECDGAMYHSSAVARDRDRLRQSILEGLGWNIHRIWSTRWIHDPQGEIAAVVDRIEALRKAPSGALAEAILGPEAMPDRPPLKLLVVSADPAEPSAPEPRPVPELHVASLPHSGSAAGPAEASRPTRYRQFGGSLGGDLYTMPYSRLTAIVEQVVDQEGPIHEELLMQRIARAFGLGRAGQVIQDRLRRCIAYARREGRVSTRGTSWSRMHHVRAHLTPFVWPKTVPELPRWAPAGETRKIEWVPPEEIRAAIEWTLRTYGRMPFESVLHGAKDALGYGRLGAEIRAAVEAEIRVLISDGRLLQTDAGIDLAG